MYPYNVPTMPLGLFVFTFTDTEAPVMLVMGANTTSIFGVNVEIENAVLGDWIAFVAAFVAAVVETTERPGLAWYPG